MSNPIDTYRKLQEEVSPAEHAAQQTLNAHKDSHHAAMFNTGTNHERAARSHDYAREAHTAAHAASSSKSAKKYHRAMMLHHDFLKGHHDSMFI